MFKQISSGKRKSLLTIQQNNLSSFALTSLAYAYLWKWHKLLVQLPISDKGWILATNNIKKHYQTLSFKVAYIALEIEAEVGIYS